MRGKCLSYLIYITFTHLVMPHATEEFYRQQKLVKVEVKKQSLMATALQSTRPAPEHHIAQFGVPVRLSLHIWQHFYKKAAAGVSQSTGKQVMKPFLQNVTDPSKNVCFKILFYSLSVYKKKMYPKWKRKISINCFSFLCLCSISALPLHEMGKHMKTRKD